MDIQINFINESNDANNSEVVIFQKNVATYFDEIAVAWTVIQNCGQGCHHPFTYPAETTIAYSDSYGNYTPALTATPGVVFQAVRTTSGDGIVASEENAPPSEITLVNHLPMGAINAQVFKDGRLLALRSGVAPQQKAVFEFKPTIWIGVVSQVEEGNVMDAAVLSDINTEISLEGLVSADLVMTGGGAGAIARPFQFTLQNIVMA